jgi:hypothetical protein
VSSLWHPCRRSFRASPTGALRFSCPCHCSDIVCRLWEAFFSFFLDDPENLASQRNRLVKCPLAINCSSTLSQEFFPHVVLGLTEIVPLETRTQAQYLAVFCLWELSYDPQVCQTLAMLVLVGSVRE